VFPAETEPAGLSSEHLMALASECLRIRGLEGAWGCGWRPNGGRLGPDARSDRSGGVVVTARAGMVIRNRTTKEDRLNG